MYGTELDSNPFWVWLTEQRTKRGNLSLQEVARQAGLNEGTLYQIRWRKSNPSPRTCRRLAGLFGVDEDYVLALAGHRSMKPTYDLRQVLCTIYPQVSSQRIDQALGALYYVLGEANQCAELLSDHIALKE